MASKKIEKIYDVAFHIIPTLSEEEAGEIFSAAHDRLAKEGEVLSADEPKMIDLQYTIRHNVRQGDGSYNRYNEAYLGSVKFRMSPEQAEAFGRDMRLNESVLRFLLIETVADDTRIGSVLPGAEQENEESQDRGSHNRKVAVGVTAESSDTGSSAAETVTKPTTS